MATRSITYTTARTLKTVIRDYSTGTERLWNTSGTPAFEAYNSANIANYGITVTEGSPGAYHWTAPATLPASATGYEYEATTYDIAGASLATSDLPNVAWRFTSAFDGTNWTTGGSSSTAAVVVSYSAAAAASSTDPLPAGTINCTRGDTLSRQLTGLGTLTGRSKLWVTVKAATSDADSASKVQLEETGGLLYLNGATTTSSNGSVVVDDATNGDITITLKPAATAVLAAGNYVYDVQWLTGAVVTTVPGGDWRVLADVTRATS